MSADPIFQAGVNVFTDPIRFEASADSLDASRAGMGNDSWVEVVNPLYDPTNPLFEGLIAKDFPGFLPDLQQPLSQTLARGGTNEATQSGSLFGPREYAGVIKNDWRFRHGTLFWHIVGDANFDLNHPFTGEDFGYVEWTVRKGG